jgi:hypothetical protein
VSLGTIVAAGTAMIVVVSAPNTESRSADSYGFNFSALMDSKGVAIFGIGISAVPAGVIRKSAARSKNGSNIGYLPFTSGS